MTLQEIEEKLIEQIAIINGQEPADIAPQRPFHELGIDSLGFVELLVFIEKTLQLKLIASQLDRKDFETVHSLASYISSKL